MKCIEVETLVKLTCLNKFTLITWLSGYRFDRFRAKAVIQRKHRSRIRTVYQLNNEFIKTFTDFLELKRKSKNAELFMNSLSNIELFGCSLVEGF